MKLVFDLKFLRATSVLFALSLFGLVSAFAQAPNNDKGTPGLNAAMLKLFGNNTNFIAKVEAHVYDKNHQETTTMPMGFEMYGNRVRVEINMAQVKSKDMSPEFAATMKQMGMDQMVTVMLPDKKLVLTIYPGLKSYAQTPMDKDEADSANKAYKIQKSPLGKETIDGHACQKEDVSLTDDKGVKQHAIIWEATDMKSFPIQMQLSEDDATVVMKYKDVKFGRPEDAHFQAPASMTKFDSVNALMSDAVTKKMNVGAGK